VKPIVQTLLLAILAAATSIAAWNYLPVNEVAESDARIGKLLLGGEAAASESKGKTAVDVDPVTADSAYNSADVDRILIRRFDRDLNSQQEIEVARQRGTWVLPGKGGFPAGNAARISAVIDSLRSAKILDLPSDQQQDHEKYGVADLSAGTASAGSATVLTLENAQRKAIANIVIGKAASDPKQRYVRISGQPQIYLIDLDYNLFSTDVTDWVDADLFRMGDQVSNLNVLLHSLEIDFYFIDRQQLKSADGKKYGYRARIYPEGEEWKYDLWPANLEAKIPEEPSIKGAPVNTAALVGIISEIRDIKLRDVQRKPGETAQEFLFPAENAPASNFEWLVSRGFRRTGFAHGEHQFESMSGSLRLRYVNGNVDSILIGDSPGLDFVTRTNINRYMLISSAVDESLVPAPVPPAGETGAASPPGEEAPAEGKENPPQAESSGGGEKTDAAKEASDSPEQEQDDAEREYQRQLTERNKRLEAATNRTDSLRQIHADWLYVISQDSVSRLFPTADSLVRGGGR
jgi:Domain of unknown function (DUF4340)